MDETTKNEIIEIIHSRSIKITESGCWIWMGTMGSGINNKYGTFVLKKKRFSAHRASFYVFKGEIPIGLLVCHVCDVPACVNPNHLFLGTHKENTWDMIKKGRRVQSTMQGEKHGCSKLTSKQFLEIRSLKGKYTEIEIANMFGVSKPLISLIQRRLAWKHI